MKKEFVVSWTVPSWHLQWLTVEADSEEEAIQKVKDMTPISQAEGSEFLHNGDEQDFEIDTRRHGYLKPKTSEPEGICYKCKGVFPKNELLHSDGLDYCESCLMDIGMY